MSKVKYDYRVAKCALGVVCKKCASIGDPIVVNRGPHITLYCSSCGAYIKHASVADKRYFYVNYVSVEDKTPIAVCQLYNESEKTMLE